MKIRISSLAAPLSGAKHFFAMGRRRISWIIAIGLLGVLSFSIFPFRHESPGASGAVGLNAPGALGLKPLGAASFDATEQTDPNSSPPIPHELIVEKQILQSMLSVTGTIEAGDSINVTAPFDGVIQEKHFNFDSAVDQGQVLLVLASNEIQMRIQEAKVAMLKAAQALKDLERWDKSPEVARASRNALSAKLTLAETQRKAAESEVLLKRGIIPRSEYDALLEQIRSQEIQLATANDDLTGTMEKANPVSRQIARIEAENTAAKHEELLRSLEKRSIKAPLSGVLSQASSANNAQMPAPIAPGSNVTKGQTLFNISSLAKLLVTARVDETDVTQLAKNQEVDISVDSQDMPPIRGRIIWISAQALPNAGGPKTALFEIKVEIPRLPEEELQRIRVGMSCSLSIVKYRNPHAMVIPLSFVQQENGAPFAWVKGPDGNLQKRFIGVGRTTESGIEVLKGLQAGDKVLLSGKPEA
jgi:RND family efflux transporter MFP subunit